MPGAEASLLFVSWWHFVTCCSPPTYPPTPSTNSLTTYCAARWGHAKWEDDRSWWFISKLKQLADGHSHPWDCLVANSMTMGLQWPWTTFNKFYIDQSHALLVLLRTMIFYFHWYVASIWQEISICAARWGNGNTKPPAVGPSLPSPMNPVRRWACVSFWSSKLKFCRHSFHISTDN